MGKSRYQRLLPNGFAKGSGDTAPPAEHALRCVDWTTEPIAKDATMRTTTLMMLMIMIAIALFILIPNLSWAAGGVSRKFGQFRVGLRYENTAPKPRTTPRSALLVLKVSLPPIFKF